MTTIDKAIDAFKMPLEFLFVNTDKRIYWLYLLSSIALALYVYYQSRQKQSLIKFLFNKEHWTSKSAIVDYLFIIFNSYIKVFLIGPFLISGLHLAYYTKEYLLETFGYHQFDIGKTEAIIYYTLTLTILGDLLTYLVHYIFHKVPFLWNFHKVHHSASVLNPITQYRLHPVELLANNLKGIVVFGVVLGFFDYLVGTQINKLTFLGVNIFSFIFLTWGSNLRHSHIKLTYFDWLESIFISPFQHQIHHSKKSEHYDKNLGAKLAIWDWMFGTLVKSKQVEELEFGLDTEDVPSDSFLKNLYKPFVIPFQRKK